VQEIFVFLGARWGRGPRYNLWDKETSPIIYLPTGQSLDGDLGEGFLSLREFLGMRP